MQKRVWVRMFCVILAVCIGCMGCSHPEAESTDTLLAAAELPPIHIVSLGDSIARGYGLENPETASFSGQAAAICRANGIPATVYNDGIDGQTAPELLAHLQGKDAPALSDADLITISIGANDVLGPGMDFLWVYYLSLYVKEPLLRVETVADRYILLLSAVQENLRRMEDLLPQILAEIRAKNPSCTICFLTVYNPFAHISTELHIQDTVIPLSLLTDTLVRQCNASIRKGLAQADENVEILDVYTLFDGHTADYVRATGDPNASPADFSLHGIDPHPNEEGHLRIAKALVESFSFLSSPTEPLLAP